MLSENENIKNSIGDAKVIPYEPVIDKLLYILDLGLKKFPQYVLDSNPNTQAEPKINQLLAMFLHNQAKDVNDFHPFSFQFVKDYEEVDEKGKPDIGVCLACDNHSKRAFFHMECKRLPVPQPSAKRSEKEYVRGFKNDGGIERFKKQKHGYSGNFGAIIGYIEKEDSDYWFEKINAWIKELIATNPDTGLVWDSNDLLDNVNKDTVCSKYKSHNSRITKQAIKLNHYLIIMKV